MQLFISQDQSLWSKNFSQNLKRWGLIGILLKEITSQAITGNKDVKIVIFFNNNSIFNHHHGWCYCISFDELFEYPSKASALSEEEVETDEILLVEDDHVDLSTPIRDALILALPVNPLCESDCPGLCPRCGLSLREADPDHSHDEVDDRWSALSSLADKLREGESKQGS